MLSAICKNAKNISSYYSCLSTPDSLHTFDNFNINHVFFQWTFPKPWYFFHQALRQVVLQERNQQTQARLMADKNDLIPEARSVPDSSWGVYLGFCHI